MTTRTNTIPLRRLREGEEKDGLLLFKKYAKTLWDG
jgi:hypothetical protein